MKLWSLQTPRAYEKLLKNGVLRGDGRHSERLFREPYRWMREQMKLRVPSYKGGTLLWAWHTPKPDLRRMEHQTGGYGVRLELDLDPNRVLLSDYDVWHHVLNKMYVPTSVEDYEERQVRRQDYKIARDLAHPGLTLEEMNKMAWENFRPEIEASWPKVFDLPAMHALLTDERYGSFDHKPYVQAVLEEIHMGDVVKVTKYGKDSA